LRVLVAEDERALSEQLAAALGDAGYAVDCAADGERAEFLGQTERYDAVVLDLGLPMVDGLTMLRRWRDEGLTMPVLILTARGGWHEKVGWTAARTTTCRSLSEWKKCWHGCAR
jgi:two-component system, OmpR family, response regulator